MTDALLSQSHHCERCEAKMTQSCYENFPYGFCSEWVSQSGKRERRGERFAFCSADCCKHPSSKGFNRALYRAAEGEHVDLVEFDDPNPLNFNEELNDKEDLEAGLNSIDEMTEEHFKQHGNIPPNFHQDFFALRAQAETYETAPQVLPSPAADMEAEAKKGKGKGPATTKATRAKKNHNLDVTFAGAVDQDGCVHRGSLVRDRYKSYGDEAL
jgi:hypothetical protein